MLCVNSLHTTAAPTAEISFEKYINVCASLTTSTYIICRTLILRYFMSCIVSI